MSQLTGIARHVWESLHDEQQREHDRVAGHYNEYKRGNPIDRIENFYRANPGLYADYKIREVDEIDRDDQVHVIRHIHQTLKAQGRWAVTEQYRKHRQPVQWVERRTWMREEAGAGDVQVVRPFLRKTIEPGREPDPLGLDLARKTSPLRSVLRDYILGMREFDKLTDLRHHEARRRIVRQGRPRYVTYRAAYRVINWDKASNYVANNPQTGLYIPIESYLTEKNEKGNIRHAELIAHVYQKKHKVLRYAEGSKR